MMGLQHQQQDLVELSADIDKLKLLPEITATSIVASIEIVKKLNSLLQPMTQSLQNVNLNLPN